MPIFEKNDISVLSIQVPNVADMALERTFLANGYKMSLRRGGAYGPLTDFDKANRCPPQHMHAALLEKHLSDRQFTAIFCVVRHPIARLAAAFLFREAGKHPMAQNGFGPFVRQILDRYEADPFLLDNHARPQIEFPWRFCPTYRFEAGLAGALDSLSDALPEPLIHDGFSPARSHAKLADQLDPRLLDRMFEFYSADFDAFDYEYDWE